MDAVKYIKEKVRMCHSDPIEKFKCDRCPMFADTVEIGCVYWEETDPTEAIRIVEEWSKAHPIQTRRDKFKEVFGKVADNIVCNLSCTCVGYPENCAGCGITAWWDAPYEVPKGADK